MDVPNTITWADLQWGNVPTWAGAILTSGTLASGLYIITRDNRFNKREQARKIVHTIVTFGNRDDLGDLMLKPATMTLEITNYSDAMVRDPTFSASPKSFFGLLRTKRNWKSFAIDHAAKLSGGEHKDEFAIQWSDGKLKEISTRLPAIDIENLKIRVPRLEPGQTIELELPVFFPRNWYTFWLQFTDSTGIRWEVNLAESDKFKRANRSRSPGSLRIDRD